LEIHIHVAKTINARIAMASQNRHVKNFMTLAPFVDLAGQEVDGLRSFHP
jgi:hypothetical protein